MFNRKTATQKLDAEARNKQSTHNKVTQVLQTELRSDKVFAGNNLVMYNPGQAC